MLLAERYELVRRIGSGGMATVWEGQDTVLKRTVAVKVVDLAGEGDPTLGERLRREAVTTASLSHPDIVTVYDAGVEGRTAYVVMALVQGRDLKTVLADSGPLPVAEVARIGARVAGALAAAHAGGIVHRDIKPANVLVDGDSVTVVDFGIASMTGSVLAGLTAVGSLIGTASYMAPEQAEGRPASPPSDVYALGCLLTTLLTGAPPFEAENPMGVLQQHLKVAPAPLRDRRPDVPHELEQTVADMLAKDPTQRPSATTARDRLASIGAAPDPAATAVLESPTRTRLMPMAAGGLPAVIPPRGTPEAAPAPPGRRPARRRRGWVFPVTLAAVLVTLALIAISLDRDRSGPTAGSPTDEAVAPESTEPVETTAPVEPVPAAEPEPEPEPPADPADVEALIAALDVDQEVRDDLAGRWSEVLAALEDGKPEKASGKVRDLLQRVDELARDERLSLDDAAALQAAIAAATADLPGPGNTRDDDRDDDD